MNWFIVWFKRNLKNHKFFNLFKSYKIYIAYNWLFKDTIIYFQLNLELTMYTIQSTRFCSNFWFGIEFISEYSVWKFTTDIILSFSCFVNKISSGSDSTQFVFLFKLTNCQLDNLTWRLDFTWWLDFALLDDDLTLLEKFTLIYLTT